MRRAAPTQSPGRGGAEPALFRALTLVVLFSFTSCLSPLASQEPAAPIAFAQLRDSIATISDTGAIRSLLDASRRQHKDKRDNLPAILRSGLLALRLGELGGDPDFSTALSIFKDVSRNAPNHPEAWYGRGLAEEGRSAWELSVNLNLGNRVGLKALERSVAHHLRALKAQPDYAPAALAVARLTLSLRDTVRLARAAGALRTAAGLVGAPLELALAWGRVERASGKPEVALNAFERYLAMGGNRSLGLLELSRTRLALGQSDAERAYYDGAALAGPAEAAEYLADIAPLLGDSSIARLDTLDGGLAETLRRFWNDRDRVELRSEGERLREHYRRLQYARLHFPLTISRRFYGRLDAHRSASTELDDRGIIYIRHGEPATRLRPFVFGAMPNESWRYGRAEGDLLLHFSGGWDQNGGGDLHDYRLVQSVLDLRGAADAPRDQLLLSRQSLSPDYSRMLNWGRYGAANARARERSVGAASIAVSTTTDSYELNFSRPLPVVANLIAVGRSAAGSLAHLVFGISAPDARAEVSGRKVGYQVRARLVALDSRDRPIASLDTTLVIRYERALGPGEFVVGRVELVLPPGSWTYRALLQQGDSFGVILPRDSVVVADTDGRTLQLSDIALGSAGRAITWITDAQDTVLLAPTALIRQNANVEIYYEASGVTPGLEYRHEITVLRSERPGSTRRRPLVALSFDEKAADSVVRAHRSFRLERLKEGSYVVEVKITAPDGSSQTRQRPIRLIDR